MRVAFFGLPLAALLLAQDGHEMAFAVLSPVQAPGRRRLRRVIGPERVLDAARSAEVDARLEGVDLLVSWYWTRRLPKRWLDTPRLGAIGVHPSLLPRHRGPNPFFWAIDSGDAETGVTVHRLTERYDEGPMLAQIRTPIGERNAWQLARALDRPSLAALRHTVNELAAGRTPDSQPQCEADASWAPEPDGDALRADWHSTTARVLRRIRALAPVPGLALEVCGVRLFVTRAEAATSFPEALEPGEAAAVGEPATEIVIRTGDGAIRVSKAVGAAEEAANEVDLEELAKLVASRTRAV